jgi:pyruvate-formate lyase-activating enzyme
MSTVPHMVYADASGEVFDHPRLRMAVFDGTRVREPSPEELVPLPPGSDIYLLPGRLPLGFSGKRSHLTELADEITAVSAFLAPAWLRLTHPAYRTLPNAPTLPLFAYAPVGWANGTFWTTGLRIDPERRQDPPLFDMSRISQGVQRDLRQFPKNRLLLQLRRCALEYGCRAAQNLFLKRWEAPLPSSKVCNSRCVGCISEQDGDIPVTQERLTTLPGDRDLSEVATLHFGRVKNAIASFGQGCEGEPLSRAKTLVDAVKRIRAVDTKGTINLNTNASLPDTVAELMDAGLSSIRVSLASPTESLYDAYHRPQGYALADVHQSIREVKQRNGFVSLNLLVFPGLTDREDQIEELEALILEHSIDMIQWRNMNIDPEYYLGTMGPGEGVVGLHQMVARFRERMPDLRHGYFNPYVGETA